MKRGRPWRSDVRKKIGRVLAGCGVGHGYKVFKIYRAAYGKTTLRNVYYHLQKGVELDEFLEVGVELKNGNYTWGKNAQRKLYINGPDSEKKSDDRVKNAMKELDIKYQDPSEVINWKKIARESWFGFLKNIGEEPSSMEKERIIEKYGRIRSWLGRYDIKEYRKLVDEKINNL